MIKNKLIGLSPNGINKSLLEVERQVKMAQGKNLKDVELKEKSLAFVNDLRVLFDQIANYYGGINEMNRIAEKQKLASQVDIFAVLDEKMQGEQNPNFKIL